MLSRYSDASLYYFSLTKSTRKWMWKYYVLPSILETFLVQNFVVDNSACIRVSELVNVHVISVPDLNAHFASVCSPNKRFLFSFGFLPLSYSPWLWTPRHFTPIPLITDHTFVLEKAFNFLYKRSHRCDFMAFFNA